MPGLQKARPLRGDMLTGAGMCLSLAFKRGGGFLWSLIFLPFVDLVALAYLVS